MSEVPLANAEQGEIASFGIGIEADGSQMPKFVNMEMDDGIKP